MKGIGLAQREEFGEEHLGTVGYLQHFGWHRTTISLFPEEKTKTIGLRLA
jgi:hypothetical protein